MFKPKDNFQYVSVFDLCLHFFPHLTQIFAINMENYTVLPISIHTTSITAYKWLINYEECFVNALVMLKY